MTKLGTGGWQRFHHFNPYADNEEKRAAKIAADWKMELRVLKRVAESTTPAERKRRAAKIVQNRRLNKATVTLANVWGNKDVPGH